MAGEIVILVTCGSLREARRIARSLVAGRLAACVNVAGAPVESIYRWNGKVERASERLLIIKTTNSRFQKVRDAVLKLHSYDVPEIIALPVAAGDANYLRWLRSSAAPGKR